MTATTRMRQELLDFLLRETSDQRLAVRCVGDIHGPVCMFGFNQRGFPPIDTSIKGLSAGKAVRSLERLQRTVKSGGAKWDKAWNALTKSAWDCLSSGNLKRPIPLTSRVPRPRDIAPLIPGALAFAKKRGKALISRDIAVLSVLIAYRRLYDEEPTVKRAPAFINKIEKLYRDVLPAKGFNVGGLGTLHTLIKKSAKYR